jgi:hypothetical protein
MKIRYNFSAYEPWGGAIDNYRLWLEQGNSHTDLERAFKALFGNKTVDATTINYILWFNPSALGLCVHPEEEGEDSE